MLFSIIVPVYNVENYLRRCVDSLIHQTYKNLEIILVDDGSPDNCPAICDEYAQKDSRIRVIHKENGGLSDARNKGLDAATGDYVLFVDSDDYIEPDACEKFLRYAEKGCDILIGEFLCEGGDYNTQWIKTCEIIDGKTYYKRLLKAKQYAVVVWVNAYRREFLEKSGLRFKFGILHEDFEFTPRAFLAAETVLWCPNCFYHYVIRENSITQKKDKRKNAEDIYNTCCEHEARFRSLEDEELRRLLMDFTVTNYLSAFYSAKSYQYGKQYIHKDFCLRNAYTLKTKCKSWVFAISPRLYWHINNLWRKLH